MQDKKSSESLSFFEKCRNQINDQSNNCNQHIKRKRDDNDISNLGYYFGPRGFVDYNRSNIKQKGKSKTYK
jgi:hypothetical protein